MQSNPLVKTIGKNLLPKNFKLKIEPMPHQWESYKQIIASDNNRFGEFSTEATGKTMPALMAALTYIKWGNNVVILTTRTLMPQMVSEWDKYFENTGVSPVIQPKDFEEGYPPLLLGSHATLIIKRYWAAYKKHYDFIIIDESSLVLSNPRGRRLERVQALLNKRDKGLLLMSATPFSKDMQTVYGHIKCLVPAMYRNWQAFARMHIKYDPKSPFPKEIGVKRPNQAKLWLEKRSIRWLKEEVWELPEPEIHYRSLRLLPDQLEIYKDFKEFAFFEDFETDTIFDASYSPGLKYQKGMLACSNPSTFTRGTKSCILEDVVELLGELGDQKLILFFVYAKTAAYYAAELEKLGFSVARMYDNFEEVEIFQSDSQIICGTLAKMSFGHNLQFCRNIYHCELLPVPAVFSQASNRIHRPGGIGTAHIYVPKIAGLYNTALEKLGGRTKIMRQIIDITASILDTLTKK